MILTRENIKSGLIYNMIKAGEGLIPLLSEEEIIASYKQAIARAPGDGDLWVFGYGSLIWNPAFHFEESRIARLHGYHRRFCLWTHLGRGSPDRPGMVLGLEPGGSCTGVALRIAREKLLEEFDIIWRREMVSGAYKPLWKRPMTPDGPVDAVTFVINRAHPRYAADASDEEIAQSLAHAKGPLGAAHEYLHNTVEHLRELGIHDRPLIRLADRVRALQQAAAR